MVEVALSAGCERRFTRRFTVFADPPTLGTTAAQLPQVAPVAPRPATAAAARAAGAAPPTIAARPRAQRGASGAGGAPRARRAQGPDDGARQRTQRAAGGAPRATRRRCRERPQAGAAGARAPPPPRERRACCSIRACAHLKLDMEEPIIPPSRRPPAPRSACRDLDDSDARQLQALEQSIQAIKRDEPGPARPGGQAAGATRRRRSRAATGCRGCSACWRSPLAAIAALAWKLRQQSRIAHSDWFNQSQLGAGAVRAAGARRRPSSAAGAARRTPTCATARPRPTPSTDALPDLPLDRRRRRARRARRAPTTPRRGRSIARRWPPRWRRSAAPRELSVEELLDLEQQADFFIALGQEDAAVDLLMSHLRSAGGQSPLPYTKLLEIYRARATAAPTNAPARASTAASTPTRPTGTPARPPAARWRTIPRPSRCSKARGRRRSTRWRSSRRCCSSATTPASCSTCRPIATCWCCTRWRATCGSTAAATAARRSTCCCRWTTRRRPRRRRSTRARARSTSARLPSDDAGLDLESVDVEGDTALGMLTSFEMTGFDAGHGGGRVDLELPHDGARRRRARHARRAEPGAGRRRPGRSRRRSTGTTATRRTPSCRPSAEHAASGLQRLQAPQRRVQRLVLLGEAEADHALLGRRRRRTPTSGSRRRRSRSSASRRTPGPRRSLTRRVVDALEVGALAGQQRAAASRARPARKRSRLALVERRQRGRCDGSARKAAMPCCIGVLTVNTLNWCTLRNSALSGAGAAT